MPTVFRRISFFRRLISDAKSSGSQVEQFSFLLEEVNAMSGIVASHGAQLSVLSDELLTTRCQLLEETCGRINTGNLRHVILIGAPYLPLGTDIQNRLKKQVLLCTFMFVDSVSHTPPRPSFNIGLGRFINVYTCSSNRLLRPYPH